MIWFLQLKGILATGILAGFGCGLIYNGWRYDCPPGRNWVTLLGWLVIGMIFIVPFIAVLISVWASRVG